MWFKMSKASLARSVVLPSVLALLGFWMLVGCIYIPGRDKLPAEARDPRPFVGKRDSGRPLKVETSTRDDVFKVLGQRHGGSSDGRIWEYHWEGQNGSWLVPLCFRSDPAWRRYAMRLEFGDDGRLKRFRVSHDVDPWNPLEVPRTVSNERGK
jgi:hypothetical protein